MSEVHLYTKKDIKNLLSEPSVLKRRINIDPVIITKLKNFIHDKKTKI